MTTKNTRKILSAIVAFVMILTCLVTPAMANPATAQPAANSHEAVSTVVNPATGETNVIEASGLNPELDPNKEVTIMVQLEGETTFMQTSDLQLASANYDNQMATMAKAEGRIAAALGQSIEVESRYSLLFNGFSFTGQGWMIDAINELDGVTAFEAPVFELIEAGASEDVNLTPSMGVSTGMVGATKAWNLGYTGKGMTVAIIDTGIHSTHEAFSVNPENAKMDKAYLQEVFNKHGSKMHSGTDADAVYYSAKMPFNWDYFDNDAIPNHTASEHGTHVAGIAAGNNGSTFKGVAPDAQIVTMQVFTDTGGAGFDTLMRALEDCVYLGVDAVNMSLGIAAFFTAYESIAVGMEAIYDALENAGVSVCVAAGNDTHANYWTNTPITLNAAWFNWNMDYGVIGAPATFPGSFAVASAVNAGIPNADTITAYGKTYYPTRQTHSTAPTLSSMTAGEYDIVYAGNGSPEELAAADVVGKVVLAEKSGTAGKMGRNAAAAGAVAILIFNNIDAPLSASSPLTIPLCFLTRTEGLALRDSLPDGVNGKIRISNGPVYGNLKMAADSSWGTTADLRIKPEITAPGQNITSAVAWQNQNPATPAGDNGYATWSGTSMATPHVAGGLLLIKQRLREVFPDKTAAQINELAYSFVMSTAHQVSGMVRKSGAGLMDLEGALTTESYVTVPGSSRPKLELGDSENGKFAFSFEVTNFGKTDKTYGIEVSALTESVIDAVYRGYREDTEGYAEYNDKYGYLLRNPFDTNVKYINGVAQDVTSQCNISAPESVTVKAGETVTVNMTIEASETLLTYIEENFEAGTYLEGYVKLLDQNNEADLSVPFLGYIGDWDYIPMFDLGYWWNLPYGVNNMAQMPVTKGTYVGYGVLNQGLGLNPYWDETGMTYSPDRNTISPNGDGFLETVNYAEFSLMRIPKTLKAYIQDAEGNILQVCHDSSYNYRKEYYVGGFNGGTSYSQISWDFDASALEENQTVYLVLEAWLDHEGYEIEKNMNGRMVFPFTVDTTAPTLNIIDGGVEIHDDNFIAYYGIFSDAKRTEMLYETGVFANERGVAETYMTDLDTYFVTVADYGRNEAFYMVKDGQVYVLDADGFDHSDKTIFAREFINYNQNIYEYNWVTFNTETPASLTFLAQPQHDIPAIADSGGRDFKHGVVMPDGTVYVATVFDLYELNMETFEYTHVCKIQPGAGSTFGFIRGLMLRPGTSELYVFNQSDYTGTANFYVSRLDVNSGMTIPLFGLQDSWGSWIHAWAATFIDQDTVALLFTNNRIVLFNIVTGETEEIINTGWGAPYGESVFGINGSGGALLYNEDENCLYLSGCITWAGVNRYNQQAIFAFDLDTRMTDIRYYDTGLGYDLCGLFFMEDLIATEESEHICYIKETAEATCTEGAYILKVCAECGEEIKEYTSDPLGHDYETVVTPPTCTEGGYTTYTCKVCGHTYVGDETAALGHDYEAVVTEPTCTALGYTTYTCKNCGDTYKDDYKPATDHKYGEWETVTAPACNTKGQEKRVCECGAAEYRDTDMTGHDYKAEVTAPTCTTLGYTTYTCSVCGDTYKSDFVETIGHKYTEEVVAPTCTDMGYTIFTCHCGYRYEGNFVAPTGHKFGDWEVTKEATCVENGEETRTCHCGEKETRTTFKVDHKYEATVVEPTCTEVGYTNHVCTYCGHSYISDLIRAIGHDYEAVTTAPTCTEDGYTTYTCTVCGESYVDDIVPATGHTFGHWVLTTEPGCTEAGEETRYCADCDATETREVAPVCPAEKFTDVDTKQWYHEGICYVIRNGLMNGKSETVFAPTANLTRAELVTILYRMAGEPNVDGMEQPFDDVIASRWYTDAAIWAYNTGVVKGMSETTFAPNATITREQIATILYRFAGAEAVGEDSLKDFTDAGKVSAWAVDAMNWAVSVGLINGVEETTLAPQGNATRAQIATILMRYCEG